MDGLGKIIYGNQFIQWMNPLFTQTQTHTYRKFLVLFDKWKTFQLNKKSFTNENIYFGKFSFGKKVYNEN